MIKIFARLFVTEAVVPVGIQATNCNYVVL